jgi:hypothetical protein
MGVEADESQPSTKSYLSTVVDSITSPDKFIINIQLRNSRPLRVLLNPYCEIELIGEYEPDRSCRETRRTTCHGTQGMSIPDAEGQVKGCRPLYS